ncbi:MAG TPA: DoxX family protein [Spirochaetia bacterium]|nr:DoxX family protein [Spirochaetia bacterium]HTZ50058.1 DoxX family protein [Spirochaetia bacterium]
MEDSGKLVLRLTTAGLILFHGVSKILRGVSFMDPALAAFHLPAFVAYGVYIGEVVAPLFVIAGAWTRVASLVIVFNMVVAVLLEAHRNVAVIQRTGAWGLEAEAFFLLTALVIALIGPGRYALMPARRTAEA